MKKIYLLLLLAIILSGTYAQTVNWVGSTSTNYFTAANWNPATTMTTLTSNEVLMIGNGSPNNCVHTGGSAANAYRPNRINVLNGAGFTVNGTLYPYGLDSLNGTTTINNPGDFNVRGVGYIGRNGSAVVTINSGGKLGSSGIFHLASGTAGSSATVNVLGGSFNPGSTLNIANGTGLTAFLNINGGGVNVIGTMNMGTGGSIFIGGIGFLKMTGNKVTQLNGLVASGQLTCTPGRTLAITYDGTFTYAQIPQNSNSMITEFPDSVVLKTGDLVCSIEKRSGNVLSYRYKGAETVKNKPTDTRKYMYHDFTTSNGFETMFGCTYEVVQDSTGFAHVVFKRPYTPSIGHVTPCDVELHYALKKDDKGVYVYSKLEHKPQYPHFDMGSWRQVWWIAEKNASSYIAENIYTDSLRSWQMPAPNDTYEATGVAEIIKMTSGVRNGKYDGKYEYSLRYMDHPVWGFASNVNNIGIWCLNASCEYFDEGPMNQDLNSASGIIHTCMNGVHYGDRGMDADSGTSWTKIYGPYLLLITDKPTGAENWQAAKQRQVQEAAQWPYAWVKDTVAYPKAGMRGSVSGKFVITDSKKPSLTGAGFWIGVTDLSDLPAGVINNFQFESKNYQYWVKVGADGNFTIPHVRPGTYSLFAFGDGAVGEYRQDNVTVTTGSVTNLGTITRTIDRSYGDIMWEIATPNRMANEFKMGDFDYCEGHVQQKFRDSFPNIIEYNVAQKNWSDVLPYAHTKYPDTAFNPTGTWKWRLNFTLPEGLPSTGNARLTIAYASNDHAQQWIYVNNESAVFSAYYPDNGDGNAFIRQANYARYSYKEVLIPLNRLRSGTNTVTLVMPSNSLWVSHLMYDYLSLEVPGTAILPVELLSFRAKAVTGKKAQLNWQTVSEKNSSHFELLRSRDGSIFSSVATIKATSAANGSSYVFTDLSPADGINYYRLKLVDKDGKFSYSATRQVSFTTEDVITIYPNPTTGSIIIQSVSGKPLKSVRVTDALGKIIISKTNINALQYMANLSSLAKGMYYISIDDGTNTIVKEVTKN